MKTTIDDTIHKVEALYQSITGCHPPITDGAYAPVPPEADPMAHVEAQIAQLKKLILQPEREASTWQPPVALWESNGELVMELEVAGVPEGEVEVVKLQQLVTVSGVRKARSHTQIWRDELNKGPFHRSVLLPPDIDPGKMQRSMKDGILELRFSRRDAEETAETQHN